MTKKHTRYPIITIMEIQESKREWRTVVGLADYEGSTKDAIYKEIKRKPKRFVLRTLAGSNTTLLIRLEGKQEVPINFQGKQESAPIVVLPPRSGRYK